MNLTCPEVEAQLELFSAGECDPVLRTAIAQHLAACAGCARAHREAKELLGLLTLRFAEPAGLQRLHARIEAEGRRRHATPVVILYFRRAGAVAAMLLAAISLAWLSGPLQQQTADSSPEVVWASPGAEWAMSASPHGRRIELTAGELQVRSGPAAAPPSPTAAVEVRTPLGTAHGQGAEFFISQSPGEVCVTVRDGQVQFATAQGSLTARTGESLRATAGGTLQKQVEALSLRFGSQYAPVPIRSSPHIPTRKLPLDLKPVVNYQTVAARLPLAQAEPLLQANGFAVIPGSGQDDPVAAYRSLRELGLPTMITTDVVLHLCRASLDETLREIEERTLVQDLELLTQALLDEVARTLLPAASEDWRVGQQLGLTWLAVARKTLRPEGALPPQVDGMAVDEIVTRIREHKGKARLPLFGYAEDFSVYQPQGHYGCSENLKNYYAAMTWLSYTPLLLKEGHVSGVQARQQTLAALLVTRALDRVRLSDRRPAREVWQRLSAVSGFFAGLGDDLGPQQYWTALSRVAGSVPDLALLTGASQLHELKLELARQSLALSTDSSARGPGALLQQLGPEAGFRLFGRRFIPDAYALDRLVYPHIGPGTRGDCFTCRRTPDGTVVRGLPRGLDLMALLGSQRARELLHELGDDAYRAEGAAPGYDDAFAALKREFARLDDIDWNRNLYWSWLYALKPLLAEQGDGGQPFMTSAAYRDRALDAALAAWAHRRQDTVLYARVGPMLEAMHAKEPVGPAVADKRERQVVYVEPLPKLYARLLALTRMTSKGLDRLQVLGDAARKRLTALEQSVQKLLAISEKELANQELNAAEQAFLDTFVDNLERMALVRNEDRFAKLTGELQQALTAKDQKRALALQGELLREGCGALGTPTIVTVHIDPRSGQVLQEATGLLDVGLFVYQEPDGRLVLAAGPVLSYYEMKRFREQGLTAAVWRRLLAGAQPPRPAWTSSYLALPRRQRSSHKP